ncbi:short-chain dehydrogenase [Glutamicibacter uratoxydans]|uniref:Short-chain dehydrogenase n=1 Tax=Glutamicibacter uratoxydans TaxID=43667 RepID=A0A4Y4DRC4_GLUUR|nr:SDR family oxidoreductase [Glutamicibacter uratoxydans]GED05051.1 short-chain dehydrogenase [Glutamicibacter uratoxydans]
MNFQGKTVIVTGATGGIGKELVSRLITAGANVVAAGRNADQCAQLEQRFGQQLKAMPGDITVPEYCQDLVDHAVRHFGGVDLLFNNAGSIPRGTAEQTTDQMWDEALEVNLSAAFRLSRAVLKPMIDNGGGAIVNTASAWGLYPGPGHLAYCTAKGALITMTKCMGRDHAAQGIRVNAVCPNEVDTPMLRSGFEHRGLDAENAVRELDSTVPLGHIAKPAEIVDAMLFLASAQARYITGTVLEVTGAKPVY